MRKISNEPHVYKQPTLTLDSNIQVRQRCRAIRSDFLGDSEWTIPLEFLHKRLRRERRAIGSDFFGDSGWTIPLEFLHKRSRRECQAIGSDFLGDSR